MKNFITILILVISMNCFSQKVEKEYYANGKVKREYLVNSKGVKNGYYKSYGTNGVLYESSNYKDGLKNGTSTYYFVDEGTGKVSEITNYVNGKEQGISKKWLFEGTKYYLGVERVYEKGYEIKMKSYYSNGQLSAEIDINKNIRNRWLKDGTPFQKTVGNKIYIYDDVTQDGEFVRLEFVKIKFDSLGLNYTLDYGSTNSVKGSHASCITIQNNQDPQNIKYEIWRFNNSGDIENFNGSSTTDSTIIKKGQTLYYLYPNPNNKNVSPNNKTVSLNDNKEFKIAEEYYKNKEYFNALTVYTKINLENISNNDKILLETRVKEIIETNNNYFKNTIKSQYDSLINDFNLIKQNFKIKIVKVYDEYTYKYVDKNPNEVIEGYDVCDCKKPWNEENYSMTLKCFERNKEFYEPYQIAVTENFIKFDKVLDQEENAVKKSATDISFNNKYYTFYTYDIVLFHKNIGTGKEGFNKAISLMALALKFEEKIKRIEVLNNDNKKKTLFNKYSIVLKDFQTKYNAYTSLEGCLVILNESINFLDNVIALYSTDTKDIEKQLKKADTVEQIMSIIKK